ncbi:MAG: PIG-L family deacetylase, partial [Gemmatimonadales bacterium]
WTGAAGTGATAAAQQASPFLPPGTGGVAALAGALAQLGGDKRVLVIGAHPDDEDTQLLTLVARGLGGQAAYLSLTRGEGGQNLIGPELGPELGIIRTEELLAARRLDGSQQFFTRAYDFGYSKSTDEAFRLWPRDSLLRDVLDVMRRFRPQIVVSVFSGTPRDGHGQHQVAGILAADAFRILRDSSWGPVKLYRAARGDTTGAVLAIPTGVLDPVLGNSYHQLAMASRSRHRSQDMGALQQPGPAAIRLILVDSRAGGVGASGGGGGLFAGVDTSWRGRERVRALIDSARARLNPWQPSAVVPYLARALRELGPGPADAEQRAILQGALAAAAGVAIDGVADDGIVAAGQRLQVEVSVWNAGVADVPLDAVDVRAPAGWTVERVTPPASAAAPGAVVVGRFALGVPADAPRSEPYFLRRPLAGALYDWTGVPAEWRGLPFEPPPVEARVRLTIGGEPVTLTREVVYRYRDQAIGEIRRPILVTRPFDVALSPALVVAPGGTTAPAGETLVFMVSVTNRSRGPARARVVLTGPPGWPRIGGDSLAFAREDEERSLPVALAVPSGAATGSYTLRASATGSAGARSEGSLAIIDYPHIRPRALARRSAPDVRLAEIALPLLERIGYVRGASDRVPEALAAVGLPIELLGPDSLARGDLHRFDAIVIGSRAYESEPGLASHNGRLLDYARGGGLVIVQYQQYAFVDGGFAPYPLSIGRPHDRVTDEAAPVRALDPSHPLFHAPNAIGPADWEGWVQERGLYFARDWDSTYVPLLETH